MKGAAKLEHEIDKMNKARKVDTIEAMTRQANEMAAKQHKLLRMKTRLSNDQKDRIKYTNLYLNEI